MSEKLGNFLLEMREDNEDEMEKGLKTKYIGDWGELFAYNYLENLFRINNIKNDIVPHKYSQEKYDLEVYVNNEKYVIEVKFSTAEKHPVFAHIHFNNDFKYLLLIWHPSNEEIYFAILNRKEAKRFATAMNGDLEDEDDWEIQTSEFFDDDNEKFLKRLSEFLELNEKLEDLEDDEKLYLIEKAEELVIKEHKDAIRKDFSGIAYQQWIYEYLSNYTDEVEPKPNGDEYDINYKNKTIEIKYSALNNDDGTFKFNQIKPEDFEYILFIGFDKKENKFYFEIESKEEYKEGKKENVGNDDASSQNGNQLHVGKSFFTYVNDFTFEDFDNYIESH